MTTPTFPWARFVIPYQYAQSLTGAPLPNALLYFYASGTVTPLDTFSEDTLTIPNKNPVVADQYGVFPDIFLQSLNYRVVLQEQPTATGGPGAEIWTADPVAPYSATPPIAPITVVIEMTVDGNGTTPGTGICGDLYVPFACDISAAVIQSTVNNGSVVVDIWAAPFVTNTPPTIVNSIVASDPVTLVTSQSSIDTVLTGWTTNIPAGTALRFNINSIAILTRFTMSLVATYIASP